MNKLWQRPNSAAEVAAQSSDPESFGRNLRDWQHELRRITSRKAFIQRILEPPPLMEGQLKDHGQSDAYLAAYVAWLCERHGVSAPDWVNDPERIASQAWYDYPLLWQDALVHAPGAFRRRGVFTRPEDVLHFKAGRPPLGHAHKSRQNAERQRRYRARVREKLRSFKQP